MSDEVDQAQLFEQEALSQSLASIPRYEGESLPECAECDAPIPKKRQEMIPGVDLCVGCQSANEHRARHGHRV